MKTLAEQQAHAWSLAPKHAKWIAQGAFSRWVWSDVMPKPTKRLNMWLISNGNSGFLFKAEINGWNWQDTLQSRKEFESMSLVAKCRDPYCSAQPTNNSDLCAYHQNEQKQWMPEIGEECEFSYNDESWGKCQIVAVHENRMVAWSFADKGYFYRGLPLSNDFRPLQTKTDAVRDEQIGKIAEALSDLKSKNLLSYKCEAEKLFDSGCRIIAPDERVCKPLSDEQIKRIKSKWNDHVFTVDDLMYFVQRELGLID